MSFGPALTLGVHALAELVDVQLTDDLAPDALLARLYARFLEASSPQLLGEIFHAYTARGAGDLNDAVDAYLAADA